VKNCWILNVALKVSVLLKLFQFVYKFGMMCHFIYLLVFFFSFFLSFFVFVPCCEMIATEISKLQCMSVSLW
jgi:hypothetical protein